MREFVAVALGLLLLLSTAAAMGNDNIATVTVNEETTGMSIIGANLAQISDTDAYLLGNDIFADQAVDMSIANSFLTGLGDGKTNDVQMADLYIHDTGNDNIDSQSVEFIQGTNPLTIGNISQTTVLEANDKGNGNLIDQTAIAYFAFRFSNLLTNSEMGEASVLDACVNGNNNNAIQETNQFATENRLTNSKLYEQAAISSSILGNENNLNGGSQFTIQLADFNHLTSSRSNELICLDERIAGNNNDAIQFAITDIFENDLTASTVFQNIDVMVRELGNDNFVDQNVNFLSEGNSIVGGRILQETDIETNS